MATWIRLTRFRDGQPVYVRAKDVALVEDEDPAEDVPAAWSKLVPTYYKGVRTRVMVEIGDYGMSVDACETREEIMDMVLQATRSQLFNPIRIEGRRNRGSH